MSYWRTTFHYDCKTQCVYKPNVVERGVKRRTALLVQLRLRQLLQSTWCRCLDVGFVFMTMRPHRRALALPPMRRDASLPRKKCSDRSSSSIICSYIGIHTSMGVHTTSIVAPSNFCVSSFTAESPRCLTLCTIGSTCNAKGHMQHLRVVSGWM